MTYVAEIKELLNVCDANTTIYTRKPVRVAGNTIRPLTMKQRRQVERLSTERGYRRFVAEMMTSI
jgi:ClpP class serine protease